LIARRWWGLPGFDETIVSSCSFLADLPSAIELIACRRSFVRPWLDCSENPRSSRRNLRRRRPPELIDAVAGDLFDEVAEGQNRPLETR
jgi:hypothetical protein